MPSYVVSIHPHPNRVYAPFCLLMQAFQGELSPNRGKQGFWGGRKAFYLVMVPSMSEITTFSFQFHR